jgi:predicted DNA-binding transcriptional regulator AlpA
MTTSTQERDSPPVYVTYPELRGLGVKFSRKHLLDLMRTGQFPQARQISKNRVAWIRGEILDYLANRPVARAAQSQRKRSEPAPEGEAISPSEAAEVVPLPRAAASPLTAAEAVAMGALPAGLVDDDDLSLGILGHPPNGGFVTWHPPRRHGQLG